MQAVTPTNIKFIYPTVLHSIYILNVMYPCETLPAQGVVMQQVIAVGAQFLVLIDYRLHVYAIKHAIAVLERWSLT